MMDEITEDSTQHRKHATQFEKLEAKILLTEQHNLHSNNIKITGNL